MPSSYSSLTSTRIFLLGFCLALTLSSEAVGTTDAVAVQPITGGSTGVTRTAVSVVTTEGDTGGYVHVTTSSSIVPAEPGSTGSSPSASQSGGLTSSQAPVSTSEHDTSAPTTAGFTESTTESVGVVGTATVTATPTATTTGTATATVSTGESTTDYAQTTTSDSVSPETGTTGTGDLGSTESSPAISLSSVSVSEHYTSAPTTMGYTESTTESVGVVGTATVTATPTATATDTATATVSTGQSTTDYAQTTTSDSVNPETGTTGSSTEPEGTESSPSSSYSSSTSESDYFTTTTPETTLLPVLLCAYQRCQTHGPQVLRFTLKGWVWKVDLSNPGLWSYSRGVNQTDPPVVTSEQVCVRHPAPDSIDTGFRVEASLYVSPSRPLMWNDSYASVNSSGFNQLANAYSSTLLSTLVDSRLEIQPDEVKLAIIRFYDRHLSRVRRSNLQLSAINSTSEVRGQASLIFSSLRATQLSSDDLHYLFQSYTATNSATLEKLFLKSIEVLELSPTRTCTALGGYCPDHSTCVNVLRGVKCNCNTMWIDRYQHSNLHCEHTEMKVGVAPIHIHPISIATLILFVAITILSAAFIAFCCTIAYRKPEN